MSPLRLRRFLLSWLLLVPSCFLAEADRPNILLLLADDLGYGELGSYGQPVITTPVLDELADRGVRFEQFYAGSSVCAPSRGVLMTGKGIGQCTIRGNQGLGPDGQWQRFALRSDEVTLAEMLRQVGYQTGFVGKWHLDLPDDPSTWAHARGFDYAVQEQWGVNARGEQLDVRDHWRNGDQESVFYDYEQYDCLDEFRTDLAMDFLDTKDDTAPFFLFMSYRAPHGHERVIGNRDLYADRGWGEKQRQHAAKISLLDREVGRLLDRLERDGDLANTLVMFTSDNGPHNEGGHRPNPFRSSGSFRGIKRDLYEGGIRVPLIAYWPERISGGRVSPHIAGFVDVMPTIAEAIGVAPPPESTGISFLPELLGHRQPKRDRHYFELLRVGSGQYRQAARWDDFKLVRYGVDGGAELFDLRQDLAESRNIAAENPGTVSRMLVWLEIQHEDTPGFVLRPDRAGFVYDRASR